MAGGGVLGRLGSESAFMAALGLLVFRLCFGGTMLVAHGWPKLAGFAENAAGFPDPLGVGGQASLALTVGAEVFCAAAVAVGFLTRLACLPLVVAMAVAFFAVHGGDPWQRRELAFVYLLAFVGLFLSGGGSLSIDRLLFGRGGRT